MGASNRVLLPALKEPLSTVSGVFSQRSQLLAEDLWVKVLRSHVISPESESLLSSGEVVGFLIEDLIDEEGDDALAPAVKLAEEVSGSWASDGGSGLRWRFVVDPRCAVG